VFRQENRLFVNIQTDQEDVEAIAGILAQHLPYVELKRMDTLEQGMDLSFVCRAKELGDIARLKTAMQELSPATRLSVIDQPDLIV
jgi:redox-regulated HSP33 family molecular chaperone